jgi:hypothetical protein
MPPAIKNKMTLDNILKALIAIVVSLTAMIGLNLIKAVEKVETTVDGVKTKVDGVKEKVAQMEVAIGRLETEVKYLSKDVDAKTGG